MTKVEKGHIQKGQLIALIILLYLSMQAISRLFTPTSGIGSIALVLSVGAVIVVAARKQPEKSIERHNDKRSYKDVE